MYGLIPELILLAGAMFGFIYGAAKTFKPGKALFLQIVTCAVACVLLGQIFVVVQLVTREEVPSGFHVGLLGAMGCYFFLFSGSFGQIDGLGDSRESSLRKYRIAAFFAAALVLIFFAPIVISGIDTNQKLVYATQFILFCLTVYYNCKHLILPDVDYGILKSIRPYNLMVLLLTMISIATVLATVNGFEMLRAVCLCVCAVLYALIPVFAVKGVDKWYQ